MKDGRIFECLECGRGFRTVKAARRAMWNGCPGCGGSDIDVAVTKRPPELFEAGSDLPLFAGGA